MAEFTGRCFDRAMSEMGPTQLNIPRDYFYGEITAEIPKPQRVERGAGGEKSLNEAAELLATAKFPVILSGGGVVMGDAVEECKALAERLGAPVVNSYLHNDSFPASHPLWCGPLGYQGSKAAMKLIAQADVVIALGSRHGPVRHAAAARHGLLAEGREDHPDRCRPQDARAGEEDHRRHLRRREGRGHRAARSASTAARSPATPPRPSAPRQIKSEKAAWEKELDEWTHERDPYSLDMIEEQKDEQTPSGGNYLHPRQVLRELEKAMPPRVMVSTDIGNINSVANSYLRFEKPRSFFAPMSFGNCGYALPTIIGAKVRRAAPPGGLLRRRRRLGHEHDGDHDLRAPQHPGDGGGVPQPPVGRGEEEPGRLLQPPLRRRRTRQPELRRHRAGRWARRASSSTSSRTSARR